MFSSGEEQGGNAPQMGLFIYYIFSYAIIYIYIYGFWKIGKQKMDGLFGENPIKMDDLEVPPFIEPPIYIYIYNGPL